ncbi:MAG TPA: LPS assembly lipoprotein LptE [Steroidobacteraceae bacterium]
MSALAAPRRPQRRAAAALGLATLVLPALVLAALLAGCGFHLQGAGPLPHSIALVRIDTADTESDFYFGLRKALLAAGTRIDEDGKDDVATVIHVLNDSTAQRILTVSALNVPTEYELSYSLRFSVTANGRELIPAETHTLVRDYSFSESELLAKEREQHILSEAMAHDLVSVVMRRLASL